MVMLVAILSVFRSGSPFFGKLFNRAFPGGWTSDPSQKTAVDDMSEQRADDGLHAAHIRAKEASAHHRHYDRLRQEPKDEPSIDHFHAHHRRNEIHHNGDRYCSRESTEDSSSSIRFHTDLHSLNDS